MALSAEHIDLGERSTAVTCDETPARVRMVRMPGWINTTRSGNFNATPLVLGRRVGAALLLVVAGIYRWARRRESVQATFLTTLVLLAVVIAMAPQIIGDNNATLASI
jgi:hypothetical protein